MKSDLEKGALYLIDDEFRERCRATAKATATAMGMETVTEMAMEMAMAMGMETGMETGTATEYGTKHIRNWQPYENGIVFLADIENHGNKDLRLDICKVCFNNSSGVRYLHRAALELAKRVDRI